MKWRAFSRMPQWVRLSDWLGPGALNGLRAHFCTNRCFDDLISQYFNFVLSNDRYIESPGNLFKHFLI